MPPERRSLLENQHYGHGDHRHGICCDVDLQPKRCDEPGTGRRAEICTEDDSYSADERDEPCAQEGNRQDGNQGTRLNERRRNDAKGECAQTRARRSIEQAFETSTAEHLEPVLQHKDAKQKDRDAGGDFLQIRAEPEREKQRGERKGDVVSF